MQNVCTSKSWFTCLKENPDAGVRLFCFPCAGGGPHIFRAWWKEFPDNVEILVLSLPGRGIRWKEKPFIRLFPLVQTVKEMISPLLDRPFALFGHSMGSLLCYELTRELRRKDAIIPDHLFVSGYRAPHIPIKRPAFHTLPDGEFLGRLCELNGIPQELLENQDFIRMMLPTLKADFELCETYVYVSESPLSCPITAFCGTQDPLVSVLEMTAWGNHTHSKFSLKPVPGDHFFLNDERSRLVEAISLKLTELQGKYSVDQFKDK